MSELERSFLPSLFVGHLDIFMFAGGGRARTGVLAKICAQLDRTLVGGTVLVPPIAAMGFRMVFQDRNRRISVKRRSDYPTDYRVLPVVSDVRAGPRSDWRPHACGCIAVSIERRGIVGYRRSFQAGSRGIW